MDHLFQKPFNLTQTPSFLYRPFSVSNASNNCCLAGSNPHLSPTLCSIHRFNENPLLSHKITKQNSKNLNLSSHHYKSNSKQQFNLINTSPNKKSQLKPSTDPKHGYIISEYYEPSESPTPNLQNIYTKSTLIRNHNNWINKRHKSSLSFDLFNSSSPFMNTTPLLNTTRSKNSHILQYNSQYVTPTKTRPNYITQNQTSRKYDRLPTHINHMAFDKFSSENKAYKQNLDFIVILLNNLESGKTTRHKKRNFSLGFTGTTQNNTENSYKIYEGNYLPKRPNCFVKGNRIFIFNRTSENITLNSLKNRSKSCIDKRNLIKEQFDNNKSYINPNTNISTKVYVRKRGSRKVILQKTKDDYQNKNYSGSPYNNSSYNNSGSYFNINPKRTQY